MARADLPVLQFDSADDWERWLEAEHATASGVWLKIAKKGAAKPTVSYPDALQVALCFGWIDGQIQALDEHYWLRRFTPRKPGSKWSKINTEHAVALMAAGRMRPAGRREVDAARSDGRWDAAYAGQKTIEVPADLAQALSENAEAAAFFATISSINRYAILYRIETVKRPDTRARKISQYVQMLAQHKTIH